MYFGISGFFTLYGEAFCELNLVKFGMILGNLNLLSKALCSTFHQTQTDLTKIFWEKDKYVILAPLTPILGKQKFPTKTRICSSFEYMFL